MSSRFSSSVMCGSTWSANEALKFYDIRGTDSCPTLEIHGASDDNRKWHRYSHFLVYESHEHEKANSRSFDGT